MHTQHHFLHQQYYHKRPKHTTPMHGSTTHSSSHPTPLFSPSHTQAATGHQQPGCRHAHATFDVAVHEHHHHHRLPRQLKDSTTSSIIVGVHGAGLTHALFMPPGGAVLEIMPRPGNSHYLSIANMMGHGYARSDYHIHERRANATEVRAKLLQLMGKLGGCRDTGTAVGEDA